MNKENCYPLSAEFCHEEAKRILNSHSLQPDKTPNGYVSRIIEIIIVIGLVLLLLLILKILGVHISWIFMARSVEIAIIVSLLLYSSIAFCVVLVRNKIVKVKKKYPYAVDVIWDTNKIEDKRIPGFFKFHKLLYDDQAIDRYLLPYRFKRKELQALQTDIFSLNEQLKVACSSKQKDVTRYLVSTCKIKANNCSTYAEQSFIRFRNPSKKSLLSIKEILENSFRSNFAYTTIMDILKGNLSSYPYSKEDYNDVIVDEDKIYTFFEPVKAERPSLSAFCLYAVPFFVAAIPLLYASARIRWDFVENRMVENCENMRIADAIMVKLDIAEQCMRDSVPFVQQITVPLRYTISDEGRHYISYVGEVYSKGCIKYDGHDYWSDEGSFLYTYGTNISIYSHSIECDNVPAKAKREVLVNYTQSDLSSIVRERHCLRLTENRGRYAGYYTDECFSYTFSAKGTNIQTGISIINLMYAAYDNSNADIEVKKAVKEHFFMTIEKITAEDVLRSRSANYQCMGKYGFDLSEEVDDMKKLIKYREEN